MPRWCWPTDWRPPSESSCFDGVVSGFVLRNVADLGTLFGELARVTRPATRISLLDLGEPELPVLRFGHHLWCNYAVPFVGSLLSDARAYRYLPNSLAYLPSAEATVTLLEQAGFTAVEHELLSGGISQLFIATRCGRTEP